MVTRPQWLKATLQEYVHDVIDNDPRTDEYAYLGCDKKEVYNAINFGQANFDQKFGTLDGIDKALLYARYNQPGHLDELSHAFSTLLDGQPLGRTHVFDIGCGPFTAGLAYAEVAGTQRSFTYYGVDLYDSMLTLAARLAEGARKHKGLHPQTKCTFHKDLADVQFSPYASNDIKIFITSYLLASKTLDVEKLVTSIADTSRRCSRGPAFLLYTNSAHPLARQNFPDFKAHLAAHGFHLVDTDREEMFDATRKPRKIHYALFQNTKDLYQG